MIFVFLTDGTLDVIENLSIARREYEGIDVENNEYIFFNEDGKFLKPIFIEPNITNKYLFGLFCTLQSGIFELTEAPNDCEESFQVLLKKQPLLNENEFFENLEEIKKKYKVGT